MIAHYIKIALRNLLKYKVQSVISILGLAIGFACFALAAFWIHYEMTFDDFHRDADRIYMVRVNETLGKGQISNTLPHPLGSYLKEQYPEVVDYAALVVQKWRLRQEDRQTEVMMALADSSFMQMMDIQILEGNTNFMLPKSKEVAITQDMANTLFGTESPLRQEIELNNQVRTIGAVVTGWSKHSSFHYAFMGDLNYATGWDYVTFNILVKLKSDVEASNLLDKMNRNFPNELKKNNYGDTGMNRFYLTPLTSLRYAQDFVRKDDVVIVFNYIVYFSIAGALIILCALVNYLTLFVSRIRARRKEMALRKVNGANSTSMMLLLLTEYLFTLVVSILLGMVLVEISLPGFIEYTGIISSRPAIYLESLSYIGIISLIALVVAAFPIHFFHRNTLQSSLAFKGNRTENIFRKACIVVQLVVCLSVIFTTTVINKQLHFLKHTDLGMEHHNIGSVSIWMGVDMNTWMDKIKALPMVTETLTPKYYPLVGTGPMMIMQISNWDGLDKPTKEMEALNLVTSGEDFFRFYGLTLLAGEWINEKSSANDMVITESTARTFGWKVEEAIGKHLHPEFPETYTVVGVVKDCQYKSPTTKVVNTAFINTEKQDYLWGRASILFKYKEGTWNECRKRIEAMQQKEYPEKMLRLFSEDEEYDRYLRSENALTKLLSVVSWVCILISIFGIYSLVTLTCEQRRKEIAIRKVNGATVRTILALFFKEYFLLLSLSALLAFPAAYLTMKQWIETYNRQVEIGISPFLAIFAGIGIVISASISWRVWKAANENPSEVIKSE